MIIANGYIQVKREAAAGIDPDTGFPAVPSVPVWGEAVPAQIVPVQVNQLARSLAGDAYVSQTYQIYLDGLGFKGARIKVYTDLDGLLGEFPVINVEPLRAVEQTRINV